MLAPEYSLEKRLMYMLSIQKVFIYYIYYVRLCLLTATTENGKEEKECRLWYSVSS